MIEFPSSPVVGQTYTFGARTWEYTSAGAWKRQTNFGQNVQVFVPTNTLVQEAAEPFAQDTAIDWYQLNYV